VSIILRLNAGADTAGFEEGEMELKVREVMPPHPGASFTYEQAVAAWQRVDEMEREKRAMRNAARRAAYQAKKAAARQEGNELCAGWQAKDRKGKRMKPQIRKVMPPHPGASITVEEAMAAFAAVEEEQRQARLRRNAERRAAYRAKKANTVREP
jgi:hypothetical protein